MADKKSGSNNNHEEKELSQAARKEFEAKNFSACMDKLKILSTMSQTNPKVQHNMCVCHFHQSGFQHVENLKKGLKQVYNMVQVDPDNAPSVEDTDHAVLFFNQAVILYHQRQHNQAIKILEKLFQVIEPLEDKLALQVLLLLAEACLCTQQPDKALRPLSYIDKQMTSSKQGGDKTEGKESKETDSDFVSLCERNKAKIHQLKTKCYLQLKHMRFCKRELKSVMTSSSSGHPSAALFLKSNFEYERGNYKKAIKLLTGAHHESDHWQTGESVPVMYYNNLGCVHFYMGKYHLSCHYAKKALSENADAVQVLIKKSSQRRTSRPLHTMGFSRHYELLYNAGIQLLHAGRPLAAFDSLIETVQVYSTNPRLWLRLAECCIAAHQGTPGPESVSKGIPDANRHGIVKSVIGSGPHRRVVINQGVTEKKYSNEVKSAAIPVASLEFGSLCLCNALSLLPSKITLPADSFSSTSLSSDPSDVSDSSSTSTGAKTTTPLMGTSGAPPGPPLKAHEILNLRCSVLACSSYVSLVLGDNVVALQHAKDLLAIPGLAGSLKFLGHLYAAEALVHLNRITDALQHLSADNAHDVSVIYPASPEQERDKDRSDKSDGASGDGTDSQEVHGSRVRQSHPSTSESAKATVLINLASSLALCGEWDKARKCIMKACSLLPIHEMPQEALFLAIYLELQSGNIPAALQMIKKQQIIPQFKAVDVQWNNAQNINSSSPSMMAPNPWPDNSPWRN
ncbi:CCR4-NOT transcription complex subunit 10-like isoform X2 [Apostichopus japonicus]|uniref:CCR4-NOT transcription complex subunit 10-like isoform X2 n=1 Tax=Stichopus japonicus TaxID=307972 RepID=UPI003AB28A12